MAAGGTQLQQGQKRKSSSAGLPGSGRPVKRRASKACHCCRSRKVRCDVVESGIPCTNCRLDEVECVVTEGKRRKKSYTEGDCLNHSPIESIEDRDELPQFNMFDDIDGLNDLPVLTKSLGNPVSNLDSIHNSNSLIHERSQHIPHMIYQTQGHRLTPEERVRRLSALGQHPRLSASGAMPFTQQAPYHAGAPPRPDINLPRYISPIPKRLLAEDLDYMQKKGAFYIPQVGIRNELLRSYVQYVHPYLPLLDLQEFLTPMEKNDASGHVSLLLFQAAMFAATAYVDMRYLSAMGYTNRKAARKAFFQRVKLLYDFDWEIDRVTVVQSVLLMTYWYESPNDPKDVWHWLGIAISIARTIGLNHNTEDSFLSIQKRRLWRRIWWSCYMRDRLVAIGMRRPIRIREEDYDVPELTVDDFETEALSPELCRMLGGCSAVRDGSKRVTLAKMCIAMTQVCQRITEVLEVQYSVMGHKIGVTSETTVRLVPRKSGAEPSEVIKCDRELEQWYSNMPLELRFFLPGSRERTNNHDGEVISVHRALLTGIFLTATSALHRPQIMPVSAGLVIFPELKELSRRRVREAALDITEIFRDLYSHDLIRYLPNTGVTVILPAIIIHLLDVKSTDASDRQTSMRHFQFCMQALHKLREIYSSADFAFSFLDVATRKADLTNGDTASESSQNKASAPKKQDKTTQALTPPPDAQDPKHSVDFGAHNRANMKAQSRQVSTSTSPSSEQNLDERVMSSAAAPLKDLEHMIDIDGMSENPFEAFPPFSPENTSCTVRPIGAHHGYMSTPGFCTTSSRARSQSTVTNEFDRLINLEAGSDLFVPPKVGLDDSLFKDIDSEWLAEPEINEENAEYEKFSNASGLEEPQQLETPESDHSRLEGGNTKDTNQHVDSSGYAESSTLQDKDKTLEGFAIGDELNLDMTVEDF